MRRKDRQGDIRKIKYVDAHGVETYDDIPLQDVPAVLILPIFFGRRIGTSYEVKIWTKVLDGPTAALRPNTAIELAGTMPSNHARLLAKIALGYAVACFGVDGFKPLVRDFILGRENDRFGEWVSGREDADKEPPSSLLHEIGLLPITARQTKTEYIAADIRLFAMCGGPRSCVKIGQRH